MKYKKTYSFNDYDKKHIALYYHFHVSTYVYGKKDKLLFHFYKLFSPLQKKSEKFQYESEKEDKIYLAKKIQINFFQLDIMRTF